MSRLIDPTLRRLISKRRYIWQMDFLSADELARFSRERGLSFFDAEDIIQLWQLGLLQADVVVSSRKLHRVGLVDCGLDYLGQHIYSDERQIRPRAKGWGEPVKNARVLRADVQLLFHPFRYYVIYHLNRALEVNISRMQMFNQKGFPHILEFVISGFNHWTRSEQFIPRIELWNDIASLAVITEPCMFQSIFNVLTVRLTLMGKTINKDFISDTEAFTLLQVDIAEQWADVALCYQHISIEQLEQLHQDLCADTQMLDRNRHVHTLLRIAQGRSILKLEGHLGGAIQIRIMAEMLRRSTEKVHGIPLREEDERGFGWVNPQIKEQFYGSNRVLDNDQAMRDFTRKFGANEGLRLHWYVEGTTEWYILHETFLRMTKIEVLNLRGEVAQSNGLTFRDNLREDIRLGVFSFVSIDMDVDTNYQAVRRAAEKDEMCGAFFISNPDFEFANFDKLELEEIVWELAFENGATSDMRNALHQAIQGAEKCEALLKNAKKALPEHLYRVSKKGEDWGNRLMEYANKYPTFRYGLKQGRQRPMIEAVEKAMQMSQESYLAIRRFYQVDKDTGRLVKRLAPLEIK